MRNNRQEQHQPNDPSSYAAGPPAKQPHQKARARRPNPGHDDRRPTTPRAKTQRANQHADRDKERARDCRPPTTRHQTKIRRARNAPVVARARRAAQTDARKTRIPRRARAESQRDHARARHHTRQRSTPNQYGDHETSPQHLENTGQNTRNKNRNKTPLYVIALRPDQPNQPKTRERKGRS